jgi:hypothetical protein
VLAHSIERTSALLVEYKMRLRIATLLSSLGLARSLSHNDKCPQKPAAFFLTGDSTTAAQSSNGGGWGNGFLSFLKSPAWGINFGHNGATTVSFVARGDWRNVTSYVKNNQDEYEVYVTIQVCLPSLGMEVGR